VTGRRVDRLSLPYEALLVGAVGRPRQHM